MTIADVYNTRRVYEHEKQRNVRNIMEQRKTHITKLYTKEESMYMIVS